MRGASSTNMQLNDASPTVVARRDSQVYEAETCTDAPMQQGAQAVGLGVNQAKTGSASQLVLAKPDQRKLQR